VGEELKPKVAASSSWSDCYFAQTTPHTETTTRLLNELISKCPDQSVPRSVSTHEQLSNSSSLGAMNLTMGRPLSSVPHPNPEEGNGAQEEDGRRYPSVSGRVQVRLDLQRRRHEDGWIARGPKPLEGNWEDHLRKEQGGCQSFGGDRGDRVQDWFVGDCQG